MNSDPTRAQMRKYLICIWPAITGGKRFDRRSIEDMFSMEKAIYWFAYENHSGQWSNLYSALSTSKYRPGRLENGFNGEYDDFPAFPLYCSLIRHFIKGRQS